MNSTPLHLVQEILALASVLAYAFAAGASFQQLQAGSKHARVLTYLMFVAFIIHSSIVGLLLWQTGRVPLYRLPDTILTLTWVLMIVLLFANQWLEQVTFAAFGLPVIFVLQLAALSLPKADQFENLLIDVQVIYHILVALLAYAAFAMAFISSLMYLLQEHQLRNKVFALMYRRLPSLEYLDKLSHQLILLGVSLLTLAVFLGAVGAKTAWFGQWTFDGKVLWTLLSWSVYAVYLVMRWWMGWGGKKAAWLSVLGFFSVIWNMFIVNLMFTRHHLY